MRLDSKFWSRRCGSVFAICLFFPARYIPSERAEAWVLAAFLCFVSLAGQRNEEKISTSSSLLAKPCAPARLRLHYSNFRIKLYFSSLKTDILLSTFNGAAFLDDLMQSLYAQTFPDWRLLIRDDGSTDKTMAVLKSWQEKDKDRIFILEDNKEHLGPKKSFEVLLHKSNAETIMFCDQDDYWLPDKIRETMTKMREMEHRYRDIPVMIFSDLTVVDKMLREVHSSFWEFIKVDPDNVYNIYRLLINNPVVGCTVMINKKVKSLVLPFPEQAVMHDWWIALNVAQKGEIDYISQPTILYRLHEKNNIGAVLTDRKYYAGRLAYFSKTLSQNRNAIKMLRALDFPLSRIKYMGYKIAITFSKLF